jgi:hypothetical protein
MKLPFARPFFAKFFYVLAAIGGSAGAFILLIEMFGLYRMLGDKLGFLFSVYGVFIVVYMSAGALAVAAIGYVIELLAKIEWNTRPDTDEMGYVTRPAPSSMGGLTDKQYYLSEKGKVRGPFTAPEMLKLYREGNVSSAAQIAVEENGQRRVLKNWSEIGL